LESVALLNSRISADVMANKGTGKPPNPQLVEQRDQLYTKLSKLYDNFANFGNNPNQPKNVSKGQIIPSNDQPPLANKPETIPTQQTAPVDAAVAPAKVDSSVSSGDVYQQATTPAPQSWWDNLHPEHNPALLRQTANEVLVQDPSEAGQAKAKSLRDQANVEERLIETTGRGIDKNNNPIWNPQYLARQRLAKNEEGNAVYFKEIADALPNFPKTRANLDQLAKVMEVYKSGRAGESFADFASRARRFGVDLGDTGSLDTGSADTFVKGMMTNVFAQLNQLKGSPKVAELAGLNKTSPSPELDPKANRTLLAQLYGALDYDEAHARAALKNREEHQTNFDPITFENEFTQTNKTPAQYAADEKKNLAVLGASSKPQDMEIGSQYIIEPNDKQINIPGITKPFKGIFMGIDPRTNRPKYQILKYY